MRIKKVRVRHFRSIIDTEEISLDDEITILLGKNEQGKTNFLKALESFGKERKYGDEDLTYLITDEKEAQEIPIITIWFELSNNERNTLSSISEEFKDQDEIAITKYFDGHYEIEKPDPGKMQSKIKEIKQSILKILKENKNKVIESSDYLSQVDKNKHIDWLKSLQQPDGGFGHTPGQASNITNTYYAVKSLMRLGALDQIDRNKLIQFIISCQHPNGGFGHLPNQPPQAQFTYHAIMLLKELRDYLVEYYNKNIKELDSILKPEGIIRLINNILSTQAFSDKKEINVLKEKLESLGDITKSNLQTTTINMIPKFVYFDSVDIINDTISLDDYLEDREKYKTFTRLFQLAGLNIDKVKDTTTPHGRKLLFRNASTRITGKINEFWTQEDVRVNLDIDGNQILVFIEDDVGAKADPPSRRSDGFRWFLSFYINFTAGTEDELKKSLLLLDNLGWVLHPSGQRDLLKTLEEISKTNQIIFATHSPFLIDKNKLERIRIVERRENEGTKLYEKFWDSMYDSLQVVRSSIGADVSDSLFGHKNNIVMEGFSDKIYLEALSKYLKRKNKETFNLNKVMIIGAGGADKVPYLVSWFKAEKYNSLAILDADSEGRNVIRKLEKKNIGIDRDLDFLVLNEISEDFSEKDLEIEDLFGEEFYCAAVNRAYKEIFKNKLKRSEIRINDIPSGSLRTKRYSKFFKERNLGGFDKVKVALEVKKILTRRMSEDMEDKLDETIDNFERLFSKIIEKFKNSGIDIQ